MRKEKIPETRVVTSFSKMSRFQQEMWRHAKKPRCVAQTRKKQSIQTVSEGVSDVALGRQELQSNYKCVQRTEGKHISGFKGKHDNNK